MDQIPLVIVMNDFIPSYQNLEETTEFSPNSGTKDNLEIARHSGEEYVVKPVDPSEASSALCVDVFARNIDDAPSPQLKYDPDEEVLIVERLDGAEPAENSDYTEPDVDSLYRATAFEALAGQGDTYENILENQDRFIGIDYDSACEDIDRVIQSVIQHGEIIAENADIEFNKESLAEEISNMATEVNIGRFSMMASANQYISDQDAEQLLENIEKARSDPHNLLEDSIDDSANDAVFI